MALTSNADDAETTATPDVEQGVRPDPSQQDQTALDTLATITQTQQPQTQCVRWNGTWPTAGGPMASELVATHLGSLDDQRKAAKAYYELLIQDDPDLRDLNGDGPPVACILILPESCDVRIVYALGYPQNVLNPAAANSLYGLMGDLTHSATIPDMIKLPATVLSKHTFALPSKEMLDQKSANWPTSWPVWKASEVTGDGVTGDSMLLAPVPFYTVIDGLDQDLDNLELAERLSSVDNAENEAYITHALTLLAASMVKYTASSRKPAVHSSILMARPSTELQRWAKKKSATLLPVAPGNPQSAPPNTAQQDLLNLMQAFIASQTANPVRTNNHPPTTAAVPTTSAQTWAEKLGMSDTDVKLTLTLCGLEAGEEDVLPAWYTKIAEKNTSQAAKDRICIEALSRNLLYPGAPIPLTKTILQMMQSKNWLGGEHIATYANAGKGCSPYLVAPVSDETISQWNEIHAQIALASNVTISDIAKTRQKIVVPDTFDKLVKLLRKYINFLQATFGSACPFAVILRNMLGSLEGYSDSAQSTITKQTIASILWIILLQSRHFAVGQMHGPTGILPEFKLLQDDITAKRGNISHAELPAKFLELPSKPKPSGTGETSAGTDTGGVSIPPSPSKAPRVERTVALHPLIRDKLGGLLKNAASRNLSISNLCKVCGTTPKHLYPAGKCATAAVFGTCTILRCKRQHVVPTDEEAKIIVDKFAPIINDPTKIPDKSG